jgi:ribosomal protein S6
MSKEQHIDHTEQEGINVYELGFHFVPTVAEDALAVQFSQLKAMIEKRGGEFIAEDFPKMVPLAYEISKTLKSIKKRYNDAYFGWVKFTLKPEDIADLEKEIKAFEPVLRYILISTVRENTLVGSLKERDNNRKASAGKSEAEGEVASTEAQPVKINEVEVDKSINELL